MAAGLIKQYARKKYQGKFRTKFILAYTEWETNGAVGRQINYQGALKSCRNVDPHEWELDERDHNLADIQAVRDYFDGVDCYLAKSELVLNDLDIFSNELVVRGLTAAVMLDDTEAMMFKLQFAEHIEPAIAKN